MAASLERGGEGRARRASSDSGEDDFAYAALVNRWRRERATTALTKMDDRFYEEFDRHLKGLHEEYHREQAVNPATPKVLILLDELTNLQRVRDDLYDLREKKIVTSAILAARDGRPDRAQMTSEEETLFHALVGVLHESRRALLRKAPEAPRAPGGPPMLPDPAPAPVSAAQPAAVFAERSPPAPPPEAPLEAPPAPTTRAAPPVENVAAPAHERDERPAHPPRVLVRITRNVEPFVAPDLRSYHLQAEDVAALPRDVAHLLVQRGLAVALGA